MALKSPAVQNFSVVRGTAPNLDYAVTDDTGVAVTVTGWSAKWEVYRLSDNTLILTRQTSDGGVTIPDANTLRVPLSATDTKTTLGLSSYFVRMSRTDAGFEWCCAEGTLTLKGPAV